MSQGQARAWWADVEHLREAAERRIAERAPERRAALPADDAPERDWTRAAADHFDELAARRDHRALTTVEPATGAADPASGRFARPDAAAETRSTGRFARPEAAAPASRRFARAGEERPVVSAPRDERGPDAADRSIHIAQPVDLERTRRARDEHGARRRPQSGAPASARRTIEIRGQVVPPRHSAQAALRAQAAMADAELPIRSTRRRPSRSPAERFAARPDRIALWAFLFGIFLIVVAATSGH